jgi:hypothetical protein
VDDVEAASLDAAVYRVWAKTQRDQLPMRYRAVLPIREPGDLMVT